VLRIREYLTGELGKLNDEQARAKSRGHACRLSKGLATMQEDDRHIIKFGAERNRCASCVFIGVLGELRGVVGVHLASLAAAHGFGVAGELAAFLPAAADDR